MPTFTTINANYQPAGNARVWSKGSKTYSWLDRGKITDPQSARQVQFQRELLELCVHIGGDILPVYVSWTNVRGRRMDWGCIAHAFEAGLLAEPQDNSEGYVSQVQVLGT